MDAHWLRSRLAYGRSIASLARELGVHPSTVAYWVGKHGLVSQHAQRHAPRGGVDRSRLEALIEQGLSVREIGSALDLGATSVRYWLRRHGLSTRPARYWRRDEERPAAIVRECRRHGWTVFGDTSGGQYRCLLCARSSVAERRRRVKRMLVEEFGGRCAACGYDRYPGALQFHHVDPAGKSFPINDRGATRSMEKLRNEARKCVLLCANCHAEVEAGVLILPYHVRGAAAEP